MTSANTVFRDGNSNKLAHNIQKMTSTIMVSRDDGSNNNLLILLVNIMIFERFACKHTSKHKEKLYEMVLKMVISFIQQSITM